MASNDINPSNSNAPDSSLAVKDNKTYLQNEQLVQPPFISPHSHQEYPETLGFFDDEAGEMGCVFRNQEKLGFFDGEAGVMGSGVRYQEGTLQPHVFTPMPYNTPQVGWFGFNNAYPRDDGFGVNGEPCALPQVLWNGEYGGYEGAKDIDIYEFQRSYQIRGFSFMPNDDVLVKDYLWRKINGFQIRCCPVRDAEVYKQSPKDLTERFPLLLNSRSWYFFSPRMKRYKNGGRPNRVAGNGHWKATGKVQELKVKVGHDVIYAYKRSLSYLEGKPGEDRKTNWLMHEYTLDRPERDDGASTSSDMKLDDVVLCEIYTAGGTSTTVSQQIGEENSY